MIVASSIYSTVMNLITFVCAIICIIFLYLAYTGNSEGLLQFANDAREVMRSFDDGYRNLRSAL